LPERKIGKKSKIGSSLPLTYSYQDLINTPNGNKTSNITQYVVIVFRKVLLIKTLAVTVNKMVVL